MTTFQNLNAVNEPLVSQFALIQADIDNTQACETLEQECAHLYARGKERMWLPQMATQLTGHFIAKMPDVIMFGREITVYAQGVGSKTQGLNDSLKMVALHSALLSGFTDAKTIETALSNWLVEDSINEDLDCAELALDLITSMIVAEILNPETGNAVTDDGAFYEAYGVTEQTNDLRVLTMERLWEFAQPRMQPMKHAITWVLDGKNATCEIPNLKLINGKSIASADFVEAANRASQTGYRVNTAIRVELELWLERAEMPELPEDEREALKVVNKYEDQVRIVEELMMLAVDTVMYFPHTADWRGRFYARGGLTQFQSIKECKAIFDFAEPVTVLDPKGLYLHVANAHGMDKVSIEDRIMWVRFNLKAITNGELANGNPYALRAAIALQEYSETGQTAVICHIDGTCNGTQWTSAMFRDEKTARLVNVRAAELTDTPCDLYGTIAERAVKLSTGIEKKAIEEFMRDLTKAPIMVLGYGAGEDTLLSTVGDYLSERGNKANAKKTLKAIMTAIKLEAPALTKLTDNLKRILKNAPRHTIKWDAFDLTVVAQNFTTEHLNLHGTSYTAKLVGKQQPDEDALARGISPNYVHSLDSAHLRAVIRESKVGLSCIHDSVGCPANMVMETNQIIREEFHKLNQVDLLENIYDALDANYTDQRGSLNIDEVLEATYIFS